RLPRAVRTDDARDRAALDLEVDALQDIAAAVAADDLVEPQERHAVTASSTVHPSPRYASSTSGSRWIWDAVPDAMQVPRASTITGSQRSATSGMLCSTIRNVFPASFSARIFSTIRSINVGL